jgi:hypothetical protein
VIIPLALHVYHFVTCQTQDYSLQFDPLKTRRMVWWNAGRTECEVCLWYSLGQGSMNANGDTINAKTSPTEAIEMTENIALQLL